MKSEDIATLASLDKKARFNDPSKSWGIWNFYSDLEGKTSASNL